MAVKNSELNLVIPLEEEPVDLNSYTSKKTAMSGQTCSSLMDSNMFKSIHLFVGSQIKLQKIERSAVDNINMKGRHFSVNDLSLFMKDNILKIIYRHTKGT